MKHRPCPFCANESSTILGARGGVWVRCRNCRSLFQDITAEKFDELHSEAWQDTHFVDSIVATVGPEPDRGRWNELSLSGTSVLEIGPGTGHLLAAAHEAGCAVAAVESSKVHRTFIQDTWGIHTLFSDITAVPDDTKFDAIVALNVLEHVYDIISFLHSTRKLLAPRGVLYVSTSNAISLEASLLRNWWAMCKEHDHVSFPSPNGMAIAAQATGLRPERVWSSELPFEFPISALVAARDWARARRVPSGAANRGHITESAAQDADTAQKVRVARFCSVSAPFDPTSRLLGRLGRAATVKARLRRADAQG